MVNGPLFQRKTNPQKPGCLRRSIGGDFVRDYRKAARISATAALG